MSEEIDIAEKTEDIAQNGTQIAAMIDKILANPEIIGAVASALGSGAKPSESAPSAEPEDKSLSVSSTAPELDTSAMLDKLPELVSVIAPMLSGGKGGGGHRHPTDRRTCLLVALKPYLCKERCETIDYMIKLGRLSEIFRNLS